MRFLRFRSIKQRLLGAIEAFPKPPVDRHSALALAHHAIAITPLIVCMSLVASTGPELQRYVIAFAQSDQPSLYESAFKNHLVTFPGIEAWLKMAIQWQLLIAMAAAIILAFPARTTRAVFSLGVLTFSLSLYALDLIAGSESHTLTLSFALENAVADVVGGLLLSSFFTVILVIGNLAMRHLIGPRFLRLMAVGMVLPLTGVLLSFSIYFLIKYAYLPIPARIDVILEPTISGMSYSERNSGSSRTANEAAPPRSDPFRLFSNTIDNANLEWTGSNKSAQKAAAWESDSKTKQFDASFEFYADCLGNQLDKAKRIQSHQILIKNLKTISVASDPGWLNFGSLVPGLTGKLDADLGEITLYSLDVDEKSNALEATHFVSGENAFVSIKNIDQPLSFYVDLPLYASQNDNLTWSKRQIIIQLGDREYVVASEKPHRPNGDDKLACRSIPFGEALKANVASLAGARHHLGVIVSISTQPSQSDVFGDYVSTLKIAGGNGWVSLKRPTSVKNHHHDLGIMHGISFAGRYVKFDINDRKEMGQMTDYYYAFGDLSGRLENNTLRITGTAKALWKNSSRLSRTRWEMLTSEQQHYAITGLIGLIGLCGSLVYFLLVRDFRIHWPFRNE